MSTTGTAITGSGVWTPDDVVTNDELCEAFNEWVRRDNAAHQAAIDAGEREPLAESSAAFIEKASGIRQRHVVDRRGILDPDRMCPVIPDRPDDQISLQAEMAVAAARHALEAAGRWGEEVDLVILSGSNLQRMYPAISIEVQDALGARGYAYDATIGCSSGTFAIQQATQAIRAGDATCALVVQPELMIPQVNWRDRDSHFIFGDAACAVVVEASDQRNSGDAFEILGARGMSRFSSNIRNNGGFVNRCDPEHRSGDDKLFSQKGRKVFKDVVPLASRYIADHLAALGLEPDRVRRFWLHQANRNMNELVMKRLLGRPATADEAPIILGEYANTASAGSIIAFHDHHADMTPGEIGVLCSFGAGYSIGCLIVRKL